VTTLLATLAALVLSALLTALSGPLRLLVGFLLMSALLLATALVFALLTALSGSLRLLVGVLLMSALLLATLALTAMLATFVLLVHEHLHLPWMIPGVNQHPAPALVPQKRCTNIMHNRPTLM